MALRRARHVGGKTICSSLIANSLCIVFVFNTLHERENDLYIDEVRHLYVPSSTCKLALALAMDVSLDYAQTLTRSYKHTHRAIASYRN